MNVEIMEKEKELAPPLRANELGGLLRHEVTRHHPMRSGAFRHNGSIGAGLPEIEILFVEPRVA